MYLLEKLKAVIVAKARKSGGIANAVGVPKSSDKTGRVNTDGVPIALHQRAVLLL